MNYKNFPCILPIRDNNVKIIDGIVQNDTANIIDVQLMEGTEPFDFTGYTEVYIEIDKPDGTHIQACVTDEPDVNSNNPYSIQIVDAEHGRISFSLTGQAVAVTGTYFAQIIVMGDGKRLTSARINYRVSEAMNTGNDIESSGDYASLQVMMDRLSSMSTNERRRIDTETMRNIAEAAREVRIAELEAEVQEYLLAAEGYVSATEDCMNQAERFAELAQSPSAEIMATLIADLDLASETYVDNSVSNATKNFDAGAYTDTTNKKLLKLRRGIESNIPVLEEGEIAFSTNAHQIYVGSDDGNIPVGGAYIAAPTAPSRTDLLWIDTSAGGSIKYYDGEAWQPTATATFA